MSVFNVLDFGATGNGRISDTAALQAAMDACAANGGGRVLLPGGKTYLSGSLFLRANCELHLEAGATLLASAKLEDYFRPNERLNGADALRFGNPVTGKPSFVFLYGFEAHGCCISGRGTIDANGLAFMRRKDRYYVTADFYPRPTMIYVEKSDHITFRDVTLRNAPFWTLHPAGCNDVLIESIRILNPLDAANSDGIDPDHCNQVRILGCHIQCADDCICLKNTAGNAEYGPCENILIASCTLISTSAAIKIGTEGVDDFKNVIVRGCVISRSNRGLSIQIRDRGNVENVSFSDITIETRRFSPDWWGTAEPVAISAFSRDGQTPCGKICNVRFFNVNARGENGVLIHGTAENPVEDILFENCSFSVVKTSKWPCGLYDLRPGVGREIIEAENAGFFLRHAKNVTLRSTGIHIEAGCDAFGKTIDAAEVDALRLEQSSNI